MPFFLFLILTTHILAAEDANSVTYESLKQNHACLIVLKENLCIECLGFKRFPGDDGRLGDVIKKIKQDYRNQPICDKCKKNVSCTSDKSLIGMFLYQNLTKVLILQGLNESFLWRLVIPKQEIIKMVDLGSASFFDDLE